MDYSSFPRSGNLVVRTVENTSLLTNNATFNGATTDAGGDIGVPGVGFSKFRACVFSDQAGNVSIQQSRDGSTWRTTVGPTAVAANTGTIIESLVTRQFVRVSFQNTGGSTQTVFEADTALVAI